MHYLANETISAGRIGQNGKGKVMSVARHQKKTIAIVVLLAVFFLSSSASAVTYFVPGDFPSIQPAIDAATAGDMIVVHDGVFAGMDNKNLDFGGKAIILRSENGPADCIIDCEKDGRGFYFRSAETSAAVVDGFTIRNASTVNTGTFPDGWGAGIYCENSSPTIKNCIITECNAHSGGGIACYSNASPNITNCIISGNVAEYGGALYCNFSSSPDISNCTIVANAVWYSGGGIYCANSSWPTITNCIMWAEMAMYGFEIALVESSSLTVSHSNVHLGQEQAYVEPGSYLDWGAGNIDAVPQFVAGPHGNYYLSNIDAGQAIDSPCIDGGNDTAANLGLDVYTTRTDQVSDTGIADIGYHYPIDNTGNLVRIICVSPEDGAFPSSAPTFTWIVFGGDTNAFKLDFAFSLAGPVYTTPVIWGTSWSMPRSVWNRIPSGSTIYWRVKGADLADTPLTILYSDENLWYFHK
jgi:hypothetical protein